MTFPVYLRLGSIRIHPHVFFEILAYAIAFIIFLRLRWRHGDDLSDDSRWWIVCAAIVGAAIGCRVVGWLETPNVPGYETGKTIVGGLAGGLVAVEIAKRHLKITAATGDIFVLPLIAGIAIGRIGCFLTGLADDTYGNPTSLPWGIDFGDGVARHPTQLYEILFVAALGLCLLAHSSRPHLRGDIFKLFMIGYMAWRLLIDLLKPGARIFGVTVIQLVCVLVLLYYASHVVRIAKSLVSRRAVAES